MYQTQIVEPLCRLETISSLKAAKLKETVGGFLSEEGEYLDGEKLLLQAIEVFTDILGIESDVTLAAMNNLAWTYNEHEMGSN